MSITKPSQPGSCRRNLPIDSTLPSCEGLCVIEFRFIVMYGNSKDNISDRPINTKNHEPVLKTMFVFIFLKQTIRPSMDKIKVIILTPGVN